jgi:hypothetical protein
MSILPNQTNINQDRYFFLKVDTKEIYTSTITANTGIYNTISSIGINTDTLSTNLLSASTISSYNLVAYNNYLDYIKNIAITTNFINLDSNALTASNGDLYINGILVATPGDITSIDKWANYPAIANIDANYSTIKNVQAISTNFISAGLIYADTVRAIGGQIDTLFGLDQINYPYARLEDISGDQIKTSSIYTNDMISEQIYNQFEISSYSVYADLGVYQQINSCNITTNNLTASDIYTKNIQTETVIGSTIVGNIFGVIPNQFNDNGIIFTDTNSSNALISFVYNTSSLQLASENNIDMLGRYSTNIQSLSSINLIAPIIKAFNNFTVEGDLVAPFISTNLLESGIIQAQGIQTNVSVVDILLSNSGNSILSSIQTNYISSGSISTQRIYADLGTFSSIRVANLSTGSISVSSINSSNGVFDNLYANNIYNTSNINTSNINSETLNSSNINCSIFTASNSATINDPTLNGYIQANATLNFGFQNNPILPDQFLYDVGNVRNLTAEQITVLGGGTGNILPLRNNSIVTIGENEITPGTVTINGINISEEPSIALTVDGVTNLLGETNVTGLLTAEGDLNVLGVLTAELEVNVIGDVSIEGGLEVVGVADLLGNTNVGGILTVTGETNLLGAVTAEAGIGVVGALGVTGGDITFGSGIDTGYTFTNYQTTTLNNTLNANNIDIHIEGSKIYGNSNTAIVIGSTLSEYISTGFLSAGVIANSTIYTQGMTVNNSNQAFITFVDSGFNTLGLVGVDTANQPEIFKVGGISSILVYGTSNTILQGFNVGVNSSNFVVLAEQSYFESKVEFNDTVQFSNIVDFQSNIRVDYIQPLSNPLIKVGSIDLSGNSILNGGLVYASTLIVAPTTNQGAGYIGAGVVFNAKPGDDFFWQLSKPDFNLPSGEPGAGSEGIYIVKRTTIDGSQSAIGRLYDNSIYTPFANVTGNIDMSGFDITNISSISGINNSLDITSRFINTSSITTTFGEVSTIATDYIIGDTNSNITYTNSLYPKTATRTLGFYSATGSAGGGWYDNINVRSTNTRTITPDTNNILTIRGFVSSQSVRVSTIDAIIVSTAIANVTSMNATVYGGYNNSRILTAVGLLPQVNGLDIGSTAIGYRSIYHTSTFTNNIIPFSAVGGGTVPISQDINSTIRVYNTLSTLNIQVSTINRKLYPYTSSLGVFGNASVSTYTVSGTSAVVPQVLLSNIPFPFPGNYLITQKNSITKASGGAGAEPYGSFCLSRGLYPSTFATEDGFNAVPYLNHVNISTFNTFTTSITVNSNATTRNLTYYDTTGHNYTLNMALADLRIRYIPNSGVGPETGT